MAKSVWQGVAEAALTIAADQQTLIKKQAEQIDRLLTIVEQIKEPTNGSN